VESLVETLKHASQAGPVQCACKGLSLLTRPIGERTRAIVFMARPEDVRQANPELKAGEKVTCHDNDIYTFLNRSRWDDSSAREIGNMVRHYADFLRTGRTIHTIQVNDRLAAWGCSWYPTEPALLTEAGGARLEFLPNSVSLHGFYTLPEFRGRKLYQALLSYVLAKRFAEGAAHAYISAGVSNIPSLRAIERVGFKAVKVFEWSRFLKWSQLRSHLA
jgi:GNAT superfamily N-acetyltransferase